MDLKGEEVDTTPYIIGGRWRIVSRLGEGSFGVVYAGVHVETGEEVAVKIEGTSVENSMMKFEAACYKRLRLSEGIVGFPRILWTGWCSDGRALVMGRLGDDLERCFRRCGGRFSLGTVLQIADQALRRLEYMHGRSLLHRDIKPENFLVGAPHGSQESVIHLIDFGLGKQYRDERTHCHIMYREGKRLTGTPRYASINAHLGIEQSRRDDLESLGYMLVYFLKGRLPWQGLTAETRKRKYERIMERKLSTAPAALCVGLPGEFIWYFDYCRGLRFADAPDYRHLRAMFWQVARREGITYDGIFDWSATVEAPKSTDVDEGNVGVMETTPPASELPPQ